MAVATFDTLKAAGVPDKQAEAQAVAFSDVIHINIKELVTKDDLKQELASLQTELKAEIEASEQRLIKCPHRYGDGRTEATPHRNPRRTHTPQVDVRRRRGRARSPLSFPRPHLNIVTPP